MASFRNQTANKRRVYEPRIFFFFFFAEDTDKETYLCCKKDQLYAFWSSSLLSAKARLGGRQQGEVEISLTSLKFPLKLSQILVVFIMSSPKIWQTASPLRPGTIPTVVSTFECVCLFSHPLSQLLLSPSLSVSQEPPLNHRAILSTL